MRTLTKKELNRALLARQLLLERGRMSLPKALERVGGIQAQYAPGKVKLEPFGTLTKAARQELDQEAERLAAFHV